MSRTHDQITVDGKPIELSQATEPFSISGYLEPAEAHRRIDIYAFACKASLDNHLTNDQLAALQCWSQGLGYKRIGAVLGISRDAARGRVDRAIETIKRLALNQAA